MRRILALFILLAGVLVTTWLRSDRVLIKTEKTLRFTPIAQPAPPVFAAHMGPFRLEGIWHISLGSWLFGGYSALIALPDGRFLAVSDMGTYLLFTPPGESRRSAPRFGPFMAAELQNKQGVDIESATRDAKTGKLWLGFEGRNAIVRMSADWVEESRATPAAIGDWGRNSGAEAMVRLRDGRFVLLRETPFNVLFPRRHDGVVFAGDPVARPNAAAHFVFDGPANFDPVDMTQLPDGRVLVLMRTLTWPFPMRFAGRIAIGDPASIAPGKTWHVTEIARIASSLPIDNFEAMAVTPRKDGRINLWLLSDDNQAKLQRTLLWKLVVDPADLPSGR